MSISSSKSSVLWERLPTQQHLCVEDNTTKNSFSFDKETLIKLNDIITKPFQQRSKSENEFILTLLIKLDFFKGIKKFKTSSSKKDFLLLFSQKIKLDFFAEGEPVFTEGDIDDIVYFVIQGNAVGYNAKTSQDLNKIQENNTKKSKITSLIKDANKTLSLNSLTDMQSHLFQPKKKPIKKIVTLGSLNSIDETKCSSKIATTLDEIIETLHVDTVLGESRDEVSMNNVEEPTFLNSYLKEKKHHSKSSQKSSKVFFREEMSHYKPTLKVQAGDCINQENNKFCINTLIATEDLYLIRLQRQEYSDLLKNQSEHVELKIEFFKEIFPEKLEFNFPKFATLFEECHYSFHTFIFHENEFLKDLYIVKEGEIQLSIQIEEIQCVIKGQEKHYIKTKRNHLIGSVAKGEVLEGDKSSEKSRYNAIVRSPKATLLKIRTSTYNSLSTKYKNVFDFFRQKFEFKQESRENKMRKIIQTVDKNNFALEQREKEEKIESNILTKQEFFDKLVLNDKMNSQGNFDKANTEVERSPEESIHKLRNTPSKINNEKSTLFQRAHLQNLGSNLFSNQNRTRPMTSVSRENENFILDLMPPSKDKKILLVNKRKRELSSRAQKERRNRIKLENDSSYKSYVDQLKSAVSSLSNRNINTGPSLITFENTMNSFQDIVSPVTTTSLVPTVNINDTPTSQKFKLKDLLQASNKHAEAREIKLISPQFKTNSNLISKTRLKQSFSSVLDTKPNIQIQQENSLINHIPKEKHSSSSLIEKIYNISFTNINTEIDFKDILSASPNRSLLVRKHRRLQDSSSEKVRNIHVERKTYNDYGNSSTRSYDPSFLLQSSSRRMLSSTNHNMFRLKSNRIILQERYTTNKTLENTIE